MLPQEKKEGIVVECRVNDMVVSSSEVWMVVNGMTVSWPEVWAVAVEG